MNNENTPNKPKQIIATKMRFKKKLSVTPKGRQYSANKNTIAEAEIMMLVRFACLSKILF